MSEEAKGPWVGRRVVVLYGSDSPEREVSLATGAAMHGALESLGYAPELIDVTPQALSKLASDPPDVAVIALHGAIGENGSIQGFLECLGVPYTGPGVYTSSLAMNKATTKAIWDRAGLPTPWWRVMSRSEARELSEGDREPPEIATPCVVKPAACGSSVGISLVRSPEELVGALRKSLRQPGPVMAEGFIEGRELSVALMDGHVMGIVEIVPKETFYDYHAKYGEGAGTEYRLPAPLPSQVHQEVARIAAAASALLDARGVVRVDVLLDGADQPWLLELNTVPGMTETSLVPKIAGQTGMSFPRFVEMMLNRACLDVEMDHA